MVSILGLWIVISEIQYVLQERFEYKFVPDIEYDSKLPIHIDITVASTCDSKDVFVHLLSYFTYIYINIVRQSPKFTLIY